MRADPAIVVFSEVAIKAKALEFVSGWEIVPDKPHIEASLANFLAMLSTIVVHVVNGKKPNPVFTAASAFSSIVPNDRFLEHTATFFAVLPEIGPNTSGVLVSVSLCRLQNTIAVLFVVHPVLLGHAVLAAAFVVAFGCPKIELSNGFFTIAL
jgi:hypothetical protein